MVIITVLPFLWFSTTRVRLLAMNIGRCSLLVPPVQAQHRIGCHKYLEKKTVKEERDLQGWRQINSPVFDFCQVTPQAGKLFRDTD